MKAVVWQAPGQIDLQEVPDAWIEQPGDAVVRLTMSAICGTDLHMVRGTMPDMVPGTVLGHEGVGVVEAVGPEVRGFRAGDRVVIPSTICCGICSYCRAGYNSQCDNANPNGPDAGTSFFGGPKSTGPINGLQATFARIPFAAANLIPLPGAVTDEQAIVLSDIYPTAWFGAQCAEVSQGDTVAVFGCGPVGLLAIASAWRLGAGRVIAVDEVASRLEMARSQHAEPVDFSTEDPVAVISELTSGIGADRVIDAVGVDAYSRTGERHQDEITEAAGGGATTWGYGTAPSQAAQWAVESVAKAGSIGIIGVYPPTMRSWPIGAAMNKNLTVKMGNCPHRAIIPQLVDLVASGVSDPARLIIQIEPVDDVLKAYRTFDSHERGWVKVALAV
ncbi:MAG: alcohol dehydrogenase catalytic domain-containing protein [Pseudonocardiaceae bacterium]